MSKNKNNQAIWGNRIKKNTSSIFQKVGNSIDVDKRLYKEDIIGSIAHVEMLFKQKIITFKIKNKIVYPEIQFLMICRNMIVVHIVNAGIQDNRVLCNRCINGNTR